MVEIMKAQDVKINSIKFIVIENKNPHWKANANYIPMLFETKEGDQFNALFTENDIKRAVKRANKNPEDCPKQSFWDKIF